MIRRRPLLRGVPRVGSPTSQLVLRRSDFRRPRSLAIARCAVAGQRLRQTTDLPSSWTTLANVSCSPTPARQKGMCRFGTTSLLFALRGKPSAMLTASALAMEFDFGALSHDPRARCLRFASDVTVVDARLASGRRHLARRDRVLKSRSGQLRKVSASQLPLSPSFAWRTSMSNRAGVTA
jgi:hypothetical protein